ncbi:MAG: hypothetical protein M1267_02720 [Candidatus Thermoplasmatota archaeon]|nr:hypothetical protein [Candidatus Thermoplasmatota archaeon]
MKESSYLTTTRSGADQLIRRLLGCGAIDKTLKIRVNGEKVLIPIREGYENVAGHETVLQGVFQMRPGFITPQQKIKDLLLKENIYSDFPQTWVKLGNALFLRGLPAENKGRIAGIMGEVLNCKSVYEITGRIQGATRKPAVTLISGNGGEIVHLENGVSYCFDPEKIMFSPGNVNVRTLASRIAAKGKVVWDVFSGIGYFSIPIAKYGSPKVVYCTDINPVAIDYLRKGATINGVSDRLRAYSMNCLDFSPDLPPGIVIMGNFDSPDYLGKVEEVAGPGATVIMHHLMENGKENDSHFAGNRIRGLLKRQIAVLDHMVVKSYSPRRWHVMTTFSFLD